MAVDHLRTSVRLRVERHQALQDHDWRCIADFYQPRLTALAKRWGLAEEADEYVQDFLVFFMNKRCSFDPRKGPLHAWLMRCAANLLCDRWRKRKRKATALGGSSAQMAMEQLPAPVVGFERPEDAYQHLRGEILPDLEREALARTEEVHGKEAAQRARGQASDMHWRAYLLCEHLGLKVAEVAPLVGLTTAACYRAVSRMRSLLEAAHSGGDHVPKK